MASIKITTVQDFIDYDMSVSAHCVPCGGHWRLSLQKLRAKYGGDLNLYKRPLPFDCPNCRGPVSLTIGGTGAHRAKGIARGRAAK